MIADRKATDLMDGKLALVQSHDLYPVLLVAFGRYEVSFYIIVHIQYEQSIKVVTHLMSFPF